MPDPTLDTNNLATVARKLKLSPPALEVLTDGLAPETYLQLLRDGELYSDALRLTAAWLPVRSAVWWACLCARHAMGKASAPQAAALQAVVQWVLEPNESRRRTAGELGKAAGFDSPPGVLATAVFFSGGSISDLGLPEVAPAAWLAAETIAGAVTLAAVAVPAEQVQAWQKQFLAWANQVHEGQLTWQTAPEPPRATATLIGN